MVDLWEDKGYRFLGLKSQNLQDKASRLEKMEQEQNYTQNTSTLFESGNRLEIELDDIEEKAPEENNIKLTCETFKTIAHYSSLKILFPLTQICIGQ